jgi:glutamate synthase (NADPH) large chain
VKYTDSSKAKTILANWATYLPLFVKVMPVEYARALAELEKAQETSDGLTVGVKRGA